MAKEAKGKRHVLGKIVLALLLCCVLAFALPNALVCLASVGRIQTPEQVAQGGEDYDAILVLGASINPDGSPSDILRHRLDTAVELYQLGCAPKLIMSGDDESDADYNEVESMKSYAVAQGIPSEDVFCDHAGVCTYDSMYRAQYVFNAQNLLVVTQRYHLYRAVFDGRALGIHCMGVPSKQGDYENQGYFNGREALARISDFLKVLSKQDAEYLSEPVSLDQSGDVTSW